MFNVSGITHFSGAKRCVYDFFLNNLEPQRFHNIAGKFR